MAAWQLSPGKYPNPGRPEVGAPDVASDRARAEQASELLRALEVLEWEGPLPNPPLLFLGIGASGNIEVYMADLASEPEEGPNG